ncbi:hypothetical protein A0257_03645 [Hymenobacter psoromatis]|nr:hypothetical protein A0257_03645 [Hymenobacter psoromatis]
MVNSKANFITPLDLEDGKILLIANDFIFIFYLRGLPPSKSVGYNFDVETPEITLFKLTHWKQFGKNMATFFAEARLRQMGRDS